MVKQDKRWLNLQEKFMDGGELFQRYWEMGDARSIDRLRKYVEQETGTKPTQMGVWKAMWRWASTNKDQAWKIYHKWNADDTVEKWMSLLVKNIRIAWQFPTDTKLKNFYKKNGYKVTYKVIYRNGEVKTFDEYYRAYYEWYNFDGKEMETIVS